MPTYDYICQPCNNAFTVQHAIAANKPACPECGGVVQQIFLSPPAAHDHMARGRELAMRSLEPSHNHSKHGKHCCHTQR